MARLIYLGKLMDAVGKESEQLDLPADISDSAQLRAWLDETHGLDGVLTDTSVRIAVNDEVAIEPCEISNTLEIVFFPPVGGG